MWIFINETTGSWLSIFSSLLSMLSLKMPMGSNPGANNSYTFRLKKYVHTPTVNLGHWSIRDLTSDSLERPDTGNSPSVVTVPPTGSPTGARWHPGPRVGAQCTHPRITCTADISHDYERSRSDTEDLTLPGIMFLYQYLNQALKFACGN